MSKSKFLISVLFFVILNISQAWALPNCVGQRSAAWQNCFGTYIFSNGDKYVGEFGYNEYNGQGTFTWARGSKYIGEFKDGKRHGQGTVISASGDKYIGEFKDDKRNGQATVTYASGDKYVGEFQDDKFDGQATYTFAASGSKWVGEWKNGNLNGYAIKFNADCSVTEEGEYKNGVLLAAQKRPVKESACVAQSKRELKQPTKVNSENNSCNQDFLMVKGISICMSSEKKMSKLNEKGYSCRGDQGIYACVLGQAEIIIDTNIDTIEFNCHNFNMCGYKVKEAATAINEAYHFPNGMDYDRELSYLTEDGIPRYCGRGTAGDVLCVKELPMWFPVTVELKKGSSGDGGINFD